MLSLSHNTTLDNALRIFKSGYIYTHLDAILKKVNLSGGFSEYGDTSKLTLDKMDISQYPGVYMSLNTKNMVGKSISKV